jgi:predicted acetyltransferase
MRKYRRQGIGENVARQVFDKFPGAWQVGQIYENQTAIVFWRRVINRYSQGDFQEHDLNNENWHGPIQTFISPSPRSKNGDQ